MDEPVVAFSATAFLGSLRECLEQAQAMAEAADACARAGHAARAVDLAGNVGELVHDAELLLCTATGIARFMSPGAGGRPTTPPVGSEKAAERPADALLAAGTLNNLLRQARQRLDKAASVARAAELVAVAGKPDEAVRFALDVAPLLHDAKRFINAARS